MTRIANSNQLRRQEFLETKIENAKETIKINRFEAAIYQTVYEDKLREYKQYLRENNLAPLNPDLINDD